MTERHLPSRDYCIQVRSQAWICENVKYSLLYLYDDADNALDRHDEEGSDALLRCRPHPVPVR